MAPARKKIVEQEKWRRTINQRKNMNASELRNWKVLSHLTTEELDDVIYVHVYGYERTKEQGLSALIIKSNSAVVYITGFCNLIGGRVILRPEVGPNDEKRMSDERFDGINVPVVELSGLGITRIVVGDNIGAAFTKDGDLYLWGNWSPSLTISFPEVMYKCYTPSISCVCGRHYSELKVGGASFYRCSGCARVPCYTTESLPTSGVAFQSFITWDASLELCCLHCKFLASSIKVGTRDLTYCKPCDLLLRVDHVFSKKQYSYPHKVEINPYKITNIFCGLNFLILQTVSNHLVIWGKISDSYYQWNINIPSKVFVKSVSCGAHHLAVISDKGELYTCGDGTRGQLGYKWDSSMGHITLRKVQLGGVVVKVCCGYSTTVCLMFDGRVMGFGEMKLPGHIPSKSSESNVIWNPSQIEVPGRLIELANSPLTNIFCARTESLVLYSWGYSTELSHFARLILNSSGLSEALKDYSFTFINSKSIRNSVHKPTLPVVQLTNLFGQKMISDLTLKLKDGDFPVHRVILLATSVYFKENFMEDNSFSTDMSSYNPKAYKCMLKYFYQVPVDDLNCDDLFDLHVIALSYKEPGLIEDTSIKLRAMLNNETVYKVYTKAKAAQAETVLRDCELFMSTHEFKNMLLALISQDKEKAMSLLSSKYGDEAFLND